MTLRVTWEVQLKGTGFVFSGTGSDGRLSIVIGRVANQRSVNSKIMGSWVWYWFPKCSRVNSKLGSLLKGDVVVL